MSLDAPDLPEPPKPATGHRGFDLLISFCALFMSAVSIYMAYHTGQSMEKLVHANSWPFIQLESGNADEVRELPILAFSVKNAGTGPARMHNMEFLFDGAPLEEGFVWDHIAEACCATERAATIAAADGDALAAYGVITTSNAAPGFLAPGEEITVLAWPHTAINAPLWRAMDQARQQGRITMRACFCSVFDECWIAETHVFPPRPVASCEPQATASRPAH